MSEEEARKLISDNGFDVIGLLEKNGDSYCFLCVIDGEEIEVCVVDGAVVVAPT